MASASKTTKRTNNPAMAKDNTPRLSKTITRSCSKEVIEKQPLEEQLVEVSTKAGSLSKEIVEQQSIGAKRVKGNSIAGSHSKDVVASGKPEKVAKASSLASGTNTAYKRKRPTEIRKKNCSQCLLKDEKLKHMEQSAKNMRNRNSSFKNQILVLEEWKQSVLKQNTSVPLTLAADINLEKLMEAQINPQVIEAELIRRKIPQQSDLWLKFESLVESEEEKIKKQNIKANLTKKIQEKELLQKQIVAHDMDIEALNQKSLKELKKYSKDIDILKTNLNKLNNERIHTAKQLEETQKKCDDIALQDQEAALTKANEEKAAAVKEYNILHCLRKDNPPPPCQICVELEEDCKTWKQKCRESDRHLCEMNQKFKKISEAKWEAAKLKGGLEAEIEFLKSKIHGTKCINVGDPSLRRMGEGIIAYAKEEFENQLAYLNERHCSKNDN